MPNGKTCVILCLQVAARWRRSRARAWGTCSAASTRTACAANSDTHGINTARMAEVWMDEYAELFYLHRPDLRNNPKIGDVTHRKILRRSCSARASSGTSTTSTKRSSCRCETSTDMAGS
ncbi:polypeptide N-acetylgalactosaminyltransferase 11-like [Manduca sexta]|uniref:polypeptide N-acetylgalactosaminyltransferase 11-like n=1 Tax=Manduca sexta TaxID=7130 RepID=UPI00189002AC|nr:polypeptide N-acetylgalactosaminyltransferase 11-like [Manduca sexta]